MTVYQCTTTKSWFLGSWFTLPRGRLTPGANVTEGIMLGSGSFKSLKTADVAACVRWACSHRAHDIVVNTGYGPCRPTRTGDHLLPNFHTRTTFYLRCGSTLCQVFEVCENVCCAYM